MTGIPPGTLRYIPHAKLAVSEPSPFMFGNAENEARNAHWTNGNWLKSRFHFAFAEYDNYANQQFGVLRVLNDDLVQPARGFGTHPHRDMEIATYIVKGQLTHKDSMGSKETLGRGAVQYMSAGTGVRHSEFNEAKDSDLRFIQMWLLPKKRGLNPNYGGYAGDEKARQDQFQHLVSDVDNSAAAAPVKIHSDANIFVAELAKGKEASLPIQAGRQAYAVILEGTDVSVSVSGCDAAAATQKATMYDAFEVHGAHDAAMTLSFTADKESRAHVLVVEMSKVEGSGRRDL